MTRKIVAIMVLMMAGSALAGCDLYFPDWDEHDRGYHSGHERDHDRGYHSGHERDDHDRRREHDGEHRRD